MNYLVTGCSRGVGLEICRVLLKEGHTIYGIARTHSNEFKLLEDEYDDHIHFKSIDLSDAESVRQLIFKDFVHNTVQLHGFVNNAQLRMMILLQISIC